MDATFWVLMVVAHLGALDVLIFHAWQGRVPFRKESQTESTLHAIRHIAYGLQFLWLPNLVFHGWALLLLIPLYVIDLLSAWTDVLVERDSREAVGGLQQGEYFLHIVLSFLVGAYAMSLFHHVPTWWNQPTAITGTSLDIPGWAGLYMTFMGITAVLLGVWGLLPDGLLKLMGLHREGIERFIPAPLPPETPRRIVTEVVLQAEPTAIWEHTIRAENHVQWDLRFDQIDYLSEPNSGARETELLYTTRLIPGLTIRGTGAYRNTAHLKASTFRFDSDDPKSLLTQGKGVWTYLPQPDGTTLLRSVYTYKARFGWPGAWFDHLIFRPVLSLATEWSFETLRLWMDEQDFDPSTRDRGSFLSFAIPRLLGSAVPHLPVARGWIGTGTLEERRGMG